MYGFTVCGNVVKLDSKTNPRQTRGSEIATKDDQIRRVSSTRYFVKSQSGHGSYKVLNRGLGWTCTCPDFFHREVKCKHIWAVELSNRLRQKVASETTIRPINPSICPFCQSEQIVRHGLRHNKYGDLQRFTCKTCKKRFTLNIGFQGMKATPATITSAMQLYFTGESLRNVQKFLRLQGVNVSHVAVYKWIRKYVGLKESYLKQIKPNVSDTWRAGELWLKVKGNMKYLFALMDDETRFWIAQEVADSKYTHDARGLLCKAAEIADKKPATLVTDGLMSYHDAFLREYWRHELPRPQHIREIRIQGSHNNNKMERLNGEVRDREKVMRGLKKSDTPILEGYQIYHNYIRPHEALDGSTPAEACGIKIEGKNKWVTLIQNASQRR
jgi:putative transposase